MLALRIVYQRNDHILVKKKLDLTVEKILNNKIYSKSFVELRKNLQNQFLFEFLKIEKKFTDDFRRIYTNEFDIIVGIIDNEILGYIITTDKQDSMKNLDIAIYDCKIETNDIYFFGMMIDKKFRGKGNSAEFLNKCLQKLKNDGYENIIGHVRTGHKPSRKMLNRCGFVEKNKDIIKRYFIFFVKKNNKFYFDKNGLSSLFWYDDYSLN